MKPTCRLVSLLLPLFLCEFAAGQEKPATPAPRFQNLGKHQFPVTTSSKVAQKYMNQGLILAYGFNHAEAIRSFEAAAKLDPDCAMAYWGIAFALGPNINMPMSDEAVPKAYEALQQALKRAKKISSREQAYIQALAKRYSEQPVKDRSKLDQDFADAMRQVWKQHPDDLDAGTLFAEALMDTAPWNYWDKDGTPKETTREVLEVLETVLAKNPNHPGANHLYIHAVEASPHPEKGLASAHRLLTLCPDSGHLVHMPSHIFLRMGMYQEATQANEKAIESDETYIAQCKAQGFYPMLYYSHNVHFLWYSLSMQGRSEYAITSGKKTANLLAEGPSHEMPYMQWLKATTVFALARFGHWDDMLKLPAPDEDDLFERAMWHYGRGLAFVRKKQPEQAESELKALTKIATDKIIECLETPEFPGKSVTDIAHTVLQAELAGLKGTPEKRISLLEKAVSLEDALAYMEPPFWYFPVRQALGAALLETGQIEKAEKVYRADLKKHPNNGWSLFGLLQSLRASGQNAEASAVQRQFQQAWKHADVTLTASWF